MKILLAEDDFASRKFMDKQLSRYGECDVMVDGEEAVDAFMMALEDGEPYDLARLDVMMPVMDGYHATKAIRRLKNPALSSIPIVALSANAFDEDKRKSKESGMNAHMEKPIDTPQLMEVISDMMG